MPLNVAVVGGSIGGAAVAAALALRGHTVTIYERVKSSEDIGFAFRITANSDRCLKHLGIDTVAGGAAQANTSRSFSVDGSVIFEQRENKDPELAKKGVSVFASRPQIARQLLDKARSLGVAVNDGVKVEHVDVEKTALTLQDGTEVSADLIIGADGLYSAIRSSIVDTSVYKPQPSMSRNMFRFMLPRTKIEEDPVLSELFSDEFRMTNWMGKEKIILSYPCDFDTVYSINCAHPAELSDNAILDQSSAEAVSYDKKVSLANVHKIFEEFEPRVHHLFDLADPDGFRIWKLQDIEELPRWSVNRTVLIGDAAHAVLPFAFSGASMTIEDAIILGELLPADVSMEEIPARLQLLERTRKPRLHRVKEASYRIANNEHPQKFGYMEYLVQYDAVEVGRSALKDYLASC